MALDGKESRRVRGVLCVQETPGLWAWTIRKRRYSLAFWGGVLRRDGEVLYRGWKGRSLTEAVDFCRGAEYILEGSHWGT